MFTYPGLSPPPCTQLGSRHSYCHPAQQLWAPIFSLIKSGDGRQQGMLVLPMTQASSGGPPDCPRLRGTVSVELTGVHCQGVGAVGDAGVWFRQWLSGDLKLTFLRPSLIVSPLCPRYGLCHRDL